MKSAQNRLEFTEELMPERRSTWANSFARLGVLFMLLLTPAGGAPAADDGKYPTN